jgi:hypothetical protein
MAKYKMSPAAMVAKGALFTYLKPRMATDSKLSINPLVSGLTSANWNQKRPALVSAVRRAVTGRLAADANISDLASLLDALAPAVENADQAPGLGQIASNPGGSAGAMPAAVPGSTDAGSTEDVVAQIKQYLQEEGVAPEILNNLDAFLAQSAGPGTAEPMPGTAPAGPNDPTNGGGGDQYGSQGPGLGGGEAQGGMGPAPQLVPQDNGPMGSGVMAGGMATPGLGGMDDAEELTEGEPGESDLGVMEPRGGYAGNISRGHGSDTQGAEDRVIPATQQGQDREWGEDEEEGEDELVPSEQDEQLGGVAKVSSAGTSSTVKNGGQDRVITKSAMDRAIKIAQDAAIKNQREIFAAANYCSQWIGSNQLAMDANTASDVYRATLRALGHPRADKLHVGALRDVLDAQPRPSVARMQQQRSQSHLAQDAKIEGGSFLERFPDAGKVTVQ